jgi:hypothetical protein
MLNLKRDLSVYVLAIALLATGVMTATQAQGALSSAEARRIQKLEAQVASLESAISILKSNSNSSGQGVSMSQYREAKIDFLREKGLFSSCPDGASGSLFGKEYPLGNDSNGFSAKAITCTATFLVRR